MAYAYLSNKCVIDTYCNTFYTSIEDAMKDTGASMRDIREDCLRFHEISKMTPRWIYFDDASQDIMEKIVEKSGEDDDEYYRYG